MERREAEVEEEGEGDGSLVLEVVSVMVSKPRLYIATINIYFLRSLSQLEIEILRPVTVKRALAVRILGFGLGTQRKAPSATWVLLPTPEVPSQRDDLGEHHLILLRDVIVVCDILLRNVAR
jgi:hypothetical protein